jgi:hypothetical protein
MNELVRYTIGAGSPPTREPGPDLSVPRTRYPTLGRGRHIEDELWPSVGGNELSEQKKKRG